MSRQRRIRSIAVVGLGQIGGSLVLAVRKAKIPVKITGIDVSRKRLELLAPYLDARSTSWKNAATADLIILCLHYEKCLEFLRKDKSGTVILDVCSGKSRLVSLAVERKLRFIGGHPLAGNEHRGEKGWQQGLFESAPFFVCPTDGVSGADYRAVKQLIRKIEARPVEIDPQLHDQFMAMTSHFPAFLSVMLSSISSTVPPMFHGPGYKSMTRLSTTPTELLDTFLQSNRRNLKVCALRMRRELDRWIKKKLK